LEASLRRLGTDYVDLYFLHCYDASVPLAETLDALDGQVRAGKIRALGASSFHTWQLAESAGRVQSVELKYSLLRRDIEPELLPYCAWARLGVIAFSPLQGGVLTGIESPRLADAWLRKLYLGPDEQRTAAVVEAVVATASDLGATPAQVALAWVLGRAGIASTLIGPESSAELEDDLGAADLVLPDEIVARLDAVSHTPLPYPADFNAGLEETFAAMRDRAVASGPPPSSPQQGD
jgi:aryl-alcohol dehydrogenase-like predicted oxidoreductase